MFIILVQIHPENIIEDLEKMIRGNLPFKLKDFLKNSIQAYKQEQCYFLNQMHREKNGKTSAR